MKACVVAVLLLIVSAAAFARDRTDEDLRLIAARVTQTAILVTTTTTSVPTTCALSIQTSICGGGRRRRSVRRLAENININGRDMALVEPSLSDSSNVGADEPPTVDEGDAKLRITVWTLTTSTYTLTSISTHQATTFSISYLCSLPGVVFPSPCG